MTADSANPKTIPADYSCGLIFREFKKTMMHERTRWLGRDRMFSGNEDGSIERRYYFGINACLERYSKLGWPKGDQSARWNHRERRVEIFADDLFLCPKCGTFNLLDLGSNPFQSLGLDIRGKIFTPWPLKTLVTEECAEEIRSFCQSRLEIKEFFFKECDDSKLCEEVRRLALSRLRPKKKTHSLFPAPITEIKTERVPEKLPWDEGHVYLIRCGAFYKIGIAKDTRKRISGLKTSSPFEMEMVKSWRCNRPDEIESILHKRYAEHRFRGEWFKLPEEILKSLLVVEDLRKEFVPSGTDTNQL